MKIYAFNHFLILSLDGNKKKYKDFHRIDSKNKIVNLKVKKVALQI